MTDMNHGTPLESRVVELRARLTGKAGAYGAQAWLRREISERTDEAPSRMTVHRWFTGETDVPEYAREVIDELENEAERAASLPDVGDSPTRNVLVLADWIRGKGSLSEIGARYGLSKQRVHALVQRAGVRRLEDAVAGAEP